MDHRTGGTQQAIFQIWVRLLERATVILREIRVLKRYITLIAIEWTHSAGKSEFMSSFFSEIRFLRFFNWTPRGSLLMKPFDQESSLDPVPPSALDGTYRLGDAAHVIVELARSLLNGVG